MFKTTLAERGPLLPLGTIDPTTNAWDRTLSLRRWNFKVEKDIGALRDKSKGVTLAPWISRVLGLICTRIGAHDFAAFKEGEDALKYALMSKMFLGDVFYAYVWLRTKAMGNVLKVSIVCPACDDRYVMDADLNTLEVTCAPDLQACLHEYDLAEPFPVRGKEIRKLLLGPPRWAVLEQDGVTTLNLGTGKQAILRGAIYGVDGDTNVKLAENELDEMDKYDIEHATKAIGEKNLGPKMMLEEKCRRCGFEMGIPIDWGYDNFFSSSSV